MAEQIDQANPAGANPAPRARIAVTRPSYLNGSYLFELIDVDGPRRGQRLADRTVHSRVLASLQTVAEPDRQEAGVARSALREIGERQGYAIMSS